MSADTLTKCTPNPAAFGAFLATYGGERCEKMLGSTEEARGLFNLVYSTTKLKLPELDSGRNHKASEICSDLWLGFRPRETHCAGMCMAFMARRGLLPIKLHWTRSGGGSKKYWIVRRQAPRGALTTA